MLSSFRFLHFNDFSFRDLIDVMERKCSNYSEAFHTKLMEVANDSSFDIDDSQKKKLKTFIKTLDQCNLLLFSKFTSRERLM